MSKIVKVVTVVQVGSDRYGPGKARAAASAWASFVACNLHNKRTATAVRDFNDRHAVAFRRSLPLFEKVLGPAKDRSNPRTLINL
ncbi:MAG: hypothetical protein N2235_02480 [Fischerella sp.]|nr:hypothetical protein [Fischerella sp.]